VLTPLVTIVTPSYNQGRFIRATIESVLSQDHPAIEYIIMDGGSTDNTAAVVKDYSSRVKWISERDRGQSDAINKGFRAAKGEIVSWLNSDDCILPGAVSLAVKTFEAKPEAMAVYGEGYLIDEAGEVTGRFPATEPFNLWKLVYLCDYILQQTVYFRKSVFHEVGYLDESLHFGLDWDLLIRIGKRYPLQYIPAYMGCLREYREAKSFSGGAMRFRELAQIMRRHGRLRYPPGYIYYGLGTYEKLFCEAIERWTPRFLEGASALLRKAVSYGAGYWIDRTNREAQGCYSDGWAGVELKYMLPPGKGDICIQGSLPGLSPRLRGQSLKVICNGEVIKDVSIGFGGFDLEIPVNSDSEGKVVEIKIKASRSVVPKKVGAGPDGRRLSYQLKQVTRKTVPYREARTTS
jgi:glycosyltransferase involved in cell wall biosynthesis